MKDTDHFKVTLQPMESGQPLKTWLIGVSSHSMTRIRPSVSHTLISDELIGDYLTFDIMLDIVYGSRCDMISRPDHRPLLESIAISNVRVGVMIPLHAYKGTFLDKWVFWSSIVARYTFIAFVKKLLLEKSAEDKSKKQRQSVYDILMGARDGEGLSPVEIAAESTNLILAGQ